MGPNRQPRKPTAREGEGRGRGRGGRGGGHSRRFQCAAPGREVAASMSTRSRDLIIDVLHHVATSGRVTMSEKHFDPSMQNVITFHKNSSAHPPAESALLKVFSDMRPHGFGFPQGLVQAVAQGIFDSNEGLRDSIRNVDDVFSRKEFLNEIQWDLCALQLWAERSHATGSGAGDESVRDAALQAMEALTDDELDVFDTTCRDELEQVQLMYEDNIVTASGFFQAEDDNATGAANDDDEDDEIRELTFRIRSSDDVSILCVVRLPDAYPINPPLLTMHLEDKKSRGTFVPETEESLRVFGSTARSALMKTFLEVVNACPGDGCLVMIVIGLINAASEITAKVAVVDDTAKNAAAQRSRDALAKAKQEGDKSRKQFVQHLSGRGGAAKPATGGHHDDHEDEEDSFVLPKKIELATVDTKKAATTFERSEFLTRNAAVDKQLSEEWDSLKRNGSLMSVRQNLPAMATRESIRTALTKSNVVIVSGETGSGKTTQVPQFLFEFLCEAGEGSKANIVCTQPRRLAATAVALRVAEERDEEIGGTVGYSIRLENRVSSKTRLLYCTTGIILRRLQADKFLGKVSHIVVDEIHERGVDTDFLLILLKDLLLRRNDLKVVLMSATMNSELFSHYFGGAPVINIAGRTFPVDVFHLERIIPMVGYIVEDNSPFARSSGGDRYRNGPRRAGGAAPPVQRNKNKKLFELAPDDGIDEDEIAEEHDIKRLEKDLIAADPANAKALDMHTLSTLARMNLEVLNYELIEKIITYICDAYQFEGAVLVFLPGMAEIQRCFEELRSSPYLMKNCVVHNLHSSLESKDQQEIFRRPPRGKRKVVLGTNIMETSITIDDAVFVIDCGKHKENQYDARRCLSKLVTTCVSKANCRQRQGRAGRVRPGICFRLFTSAQFSRFDDHQLCEMHRVPLESLVLQIYTLNLGDEMEYLAKALSPPEEKAVRASVKVLTHLGALTKEKRLTSLGQHLANLPLDVKIGKMIIHGAVMHCLDPVLTIAACYSVRSPFIANAEDPSQVEAVRRAYAGGSASDSLAAWNVYRKWMSVSDASNPHGPASKTFCRDNFVSLPTLIQIQAMKRQYERYLAESGFMDVDTQQLPNQRRGRNTQSFLLPPFRTLDDQVFESGGQRYNAHSESSKVVSACLVAGLYPNVAKVTAKRHKPGGPPPTSNRPQANLRMATFDGSEVVIHPSSVAAKETSFAYPLLLYTDKVQTSMTFIREITVISPLHIILFGAANSMDYKAAFGELVVDEVTAFKCTEEEATLLRSLKDQFDSALRIKINEPLTKWEVVSNNVVRAIVKLLREEGGAMRSMVVAVPGQTPPLTVAAAVPEGGSGTSGGGGGGGGGSSAARQQRPSNTNSTFVPYHLRHKSCFNCGETGHVARNCTNPAPPKERGAPTVRCFLCGQWHHPNECPHTRDPKIRERPSA
ncbi:DEAD/DEAH box RNA helicase, putative [Bodo saltans]|uniref:RNA helicase n=1 Tax=Bodo saltans TaxID=75058 RepID=A0A0S4IPA0_BODSA|nr:DEAD/DEAH box RNA helicase, putative [Bodo saltans]|eukprot:CUF02732.1 DEAD/DEAH box RNA helicase, putative [Bodo saltans]